MNQSSVDGRIIQQALTRSADQLAKEVRRQAPLSRVQDPTGRLSLDLPLIKPENLIAIENIQVDLREYDQHVPSQVLRNMRNEQLQFLIDAVSELIRYHEGLPEESFPEGKQTFVGKERLALEQLRHILSGNDQNSPIIAGASKRPQGFQGFCLKKIEEMEPTTREQFLSTNRGDKTFYDFQVDWKNEWTALGNTAPLNANSIISKAKKAYRSLYPPQKN